tara:strand:- start:1220 stop:2071 length:852 start_codon:yes stop_codon:yes gene_type:complete
MLDNDVLKHIEKTTNLSITSHTALSGGDINQVYLLQTSKKPLVLKLNFADKYPGMFAAEATGLRKLHTSGIINIPEVIATSEVNNLSYLLLEYIPSGNKAKNFWELFGEQMAQLHKQTNSKFGFVENNYIGSLPQYNNYCDDPAEFFITQRLEPQFKIASTKGYIFQNTESLFSSIQTLIPKEKPALLHGDLWSGNFLVNSSGLPCLIDPATSYAPREMDLAMMQLFGGFNKNLFDSYNEVFPLEKDWQSRIKLWQLYYILVHVNLFGGSYYASAKNIIKHYL